MFGSHENSDAINVGFKRFSEIFGMSGKYRVQEEESPIHINDFSIPNKILPIDHTFFLIFFSRFPFLSGIYNYKYDRVAAAISSKQIFLNNKKNKNSQPGIFPSTFPQPLNDSKNSISICAFIFLFVFETPLKNFPFYSPILLTLWFRYLYI